MTAACLDTRLAVPALIAAGVSAAEGQTVQVTLAAMLSGERPLNAESELHVDASGQLPRTLRCGLELQWDCVRLSAPVASGDPFAVELARFANAAAEPWASLARQQTAETVLRLDERLAACGVTRADLLQRRTALSEPVCDVLLDAWRTRADRVVHSEIAQFFGRPVSDSKTRLRVGKFVVRVLALPAPRTHRFFLCDALENLASADLAPEIAAAIARHPGDSLRGRWCTALAQCGRPEFAATLAEVVVDAKEETLVRALTALGDLRAKQYAQMVETFCAYRGGEKEWNVAVCRAARKALKRLR